jgi:hypothetical protein
LLRRCCGIEVAAIVVETECVAAVLMGSGYELSLLKFEGNTITTNLHPSLGRLERGKVYRVTFEEMPEGLPQC